jgi:hypothetical protein
MDVDGFVGRYLLPPDRTPCEIVGFRIMHESSPTTVPDIWEYYSQFFVQVGRRVLTFWWQQIAVGLVAGVAVTIVNGMNGVTASGLMVPSIKAIAIGYGAALVLGLLWSAVITPVSIHKEKALRLAAEEAVVSDLQQQLARRHPHDTDMEAAAGKAISNLNDIEVRFLGWLLKMNRPGQAQILTEGYRGVPNSITEKTGGLLIAFESYRPGNGLVEMDRFYYINPKAEQAIKNVLYPPRG